MPDILVGPADGTRPPHALDPELDRPIGNWTDTDLNGWMVDGRHGPAWVDDRRLVATVSDRGRSHPHVYTIDSKTGRLLEPNPGRDRGPDDAHAGRRPDPEPAGAPRIAFLGHERRRVPWTSTRPTVRTPPTRAAERPSARRWQDRYPMPEMRRVEVPGPGGPIDTWIASPPGAGDKALPTVVDVHGGPLGAWAPAPHIEVFLLVAAGYRVILPNIRGSATYGRDWIRPQLGDWGGVDAADVHAAVDHVVELGLADPEAPRRHGPELRRVHGQLAGRDDGPVQGRRVGERRHEPDLRAGPTPTAAPSTTARRSSATRSAPKASTSSGASRRCATWRRSGRRC